MKNTISQKITLILVLCLALGTGIYAQVLVQNLNSLEYLEGESVKVFGYTLDDSLDAQSSQNVSVYLDGSFESSTLTNSEGYYEYFIQNISSGSHTVTTTTNESNQTLSFTASTAAQEVSYTVIASSLEVPFSNPVLSFNVKKYIGSVLSSQNYSYSVYYQNGTEYGTSTQGTSGTIKNTTLPQEVGTYIIVVDDKKSFTVKVSKFTLKFKITDSLGDLEHIFEPNGVAYFEVEGFSSGQKISNATVTAKVTNPNGVQTTLSFTESSGTYSSNTSNTIVGDAIQLRSGTYKVEFVMTDSSNNEQSIIGFFDVLGLSIDVDLLNKKSYVASDLIEFDVVVKNLADGELIAHSDITYFFEIERNGKLYDSSIITIGNTSDETLSSVLNFTIPGTFADGDYFLKVRAVSNGKEGNGFEFFELSNTQLYAQLVDSYDSFRDLFKPGELGKVSVSSNENITFIDLEILDDDGDSVSEWNTSINTQTSGTLSFNAPSTSGDYLAVSEITTSSGTISWERWFEVSNYDMFMETKDLSNNFRYILTSGESFLSELHVFDITSGDNVDLSDFVVKFERIVEERTDKEYTNFQANLNSSASDASSGVLVYTVIPPSLPDGIYKVEYSLVDSDGNSVDDDGFFGISAFDVSITNYDSNGQQKETFASGESVNISVSLSSSTTNGTATIHREFFDPISFNITNGVGSYLLTSGNNELPSQSGFYGFGIEVVDSSGNVGLGSGFFQVRNLNFRSISVRNNGEFIADESILADITVEKAGNLLNGSNVTIERIIKEKDGQVISATSLAALTDSSGQTVINITPSQTLEAGEYFAELKVTKDNAQSFEGFGFTIVQDEILITLTDSDGVFSTSDTIDINVKVSDQDGVAKNNVTVTLTGLINLNTWGTVSKNSQAVTASNGIAAFSLSGSTITAGTYAPVFSVGTDNITVVGFGTGEFKIEPFTVTATLNNSKKSYDVGEDVYININATGTVSITTVVKNKNDVTQEVDTVYSDDVLRINNDLDAGEYFATLSITQSSKTVTKVIWFEVLAPWAHIASLSNPFFNQDDSINISYEIFKFGANGLWNYTNATLNILRIDNLWDGTNTSVMSSFNASGSSSYMFNLSSYNLSKSDYLLIFNMSENPSFEQALYFRIGTNVNINAYADTSGTSSNATIHVNTTGLSGSQNVTFIGYNNFDSFNYTTLNVVNTTGANNVTYQLSNLENGFYELDVRIDDIAGETYYFDVFFEIREQDVIFDGPQSATVGNTVVFNITSSISTTFWVIDPFTFNAIAKRSINASTTNESVTFNRQGLYIYGVGDTKDDIWKNYVELITINAIGLTTQWPQEHRMILGPNTYDFNITSDVSGYDATLYLFNHFERQKYTVPLNTTNGTKQLYSINLSTYGLSTGPHEVKLVIGAQNLSEPLKSFTFLDLFGSIYEVWAWPEEWEYKAGENVTLDMHISNLVTYQNVNPDNVTLTSLQNPLGNTQSASFVWTVNATTATLVGNSSWISGRYVGKVNITINGTQNFIPFDFFIRGEDNLEVFWEQDQWDFSSTDTFTMTIKAKDQGSAALGVEVALQEFGSRPKAHDEIPLDLLTNISSAASFNNGGNLTDANGEIIFNINLTNASLPTGDYFGRLYIGGQYVWFDFNIRSYKVDAYTNNWEYAITDSIEMSVRARNIATFAPLEEDGNVTIVSIRKHEPGNWESESIAIGNFSLDTNFFEIVDGEALIEMVPNSSALGLSQAHEFEVELEMDLETSGKSIGWSWFKVTNGEKSGVTFTEANSDGQEATTIFANQNYILKLSGDAANATLKNMWGPQSQFYNEVFENVNSTLELNFTTPSVPGFYTLEIQTQKNGSNFIDYLYSDFQIGSGTEVNAWTEGGIVPGVNFTVYAEVFGQGTDPFCNNCQHTWFGPLGNKTITLEGYKDLQTFSFVNLSSSNITATTNSFNFDGDFEESEASRPGVASFNLHPDTLNLTAGNKYDLIFSYTDNGGSVTESRIFVQVEEFHVTISRREQNLEANSLQRVWLKTAELNGTPINNCSISFDAIYDEKDFGKVKTLTISNSTNANGTYEFTYTAPGLSGFYLVTGEATCAIDSGSSTQEIGYFIDVGAKGLDVDMKTRFQPEENIKLTLATKDRTGEPQSQRVGIELFYDPIDHETAANSTQTLAGVNCQAMEAVTHNFFQNSFDEEGGGQGPSFNNFNEFTTGEDGATVIEICPLPQGEYFIEVFPLLDFENFEQGGDPKDQRFFSDFIVGEGSFSVTSNISYKIGDTVGINITLTDEFGDPLNATLDELIVLQEIEGSDVEIIIHENTSGTASVVDGNLYYEFTIPQLGTDEDTNASVNITQGPVDLDLLLSSGSTNYTYFGLQFVILSKNESAISLESSSTTTDSLINVHVETANDKRYKVQTGAFFLKDNPETMKEWFMEGGIFLENDSINNKSVADFELLTPREPGDYLLAIPVYELGSPLSFSSAAEILIVPITVKFDSVNVSGFVTDNAGNPVDQALVEIGKAETFTNASGYYNLEIAKGTKQIFVEKLYSFGFRIFTESTQKITINTTSQMNITLYQMNMTALINNAGGIVNVSSGESLNISVMVGNNYTGAVILNNSDIEFFTGNEADQMFSYNITVSDFSVLLENITSNNQSGSHDLFIELFNDNHNNVSFLTKSGFGGFNNSIGVQAPSLNYTVVGGSN